MEIPTGNHFTRIDKHQGIVRGTIHLGGDDLLNELDRIPRDSMDLESE